MQVPMERSRFAPVWWTRSVFRDRWFRRSWAGTDASGGTFITPMRVQRISYYGGGRVEGMGFAGLNFHLLMEKGDSVAYCENRNGCLLVIRFVFCLMKFDVCFNNWLLYRISIN